MANSSRSNIRFFKPLLTLSFWFLVSMWIIVVTGSCSTSSRTATSAQSTKSGTPVSVRKKLVATAKQYVGVPYNYGGKKPTSGFDCSGFTSYVFRQFNVQLAASSSLQSNQGKRIQVADCKPGDLIFFGSNKNRINHVAVVVENKENHLIVIHSTTSKGVRMDDVWNSTYWKPLIKFANNVID